MNRVIVNIATGVIESVALSESEAAAITQMATAADAELNSYPSLVGYAAEKRWRIEIGGIVRNGLHLPTSRESRSAMKDARDLLRDGELLNLSGQVMTSASLTLYGQASQVTAADLTAMLQLIAQHVQAAFDVEATVLAGIANGTITTRAQIDAAPWPSNE